MFISMMRATGCRARTPPARSRCPRRAGRRPARSVRAPTRIRPAPARCRPGPRSEIGIAAQEPRESRAPPSRTMSTSSVNSTTMPTRSRGCRRRRRRRRSRVGVDAVQSGTGRAAPEASPCGPRARGLTCPDARPVIGSGMSRRGARAGCSTPSLRSRPARPYAPSFVDLAEPTQHDTAQHVHQQRDREQCEPDCEDRLVLHEPCGSSPIAVCAM
jgi:hypothetical protein